MNIRSMYSNAPVVILDPSVSFQNTVESVARALLDEGPMSVIASFLGSCHHLDATCYAIKDVNSRVGQYTLNSNSSMRYVFGISYNFAPFMKLLRNPSMQCRFKLKMHWKHFRSYKNVISALRVVKVNLLGEDVEPELLAFLPDLQSLCIGQAVKLQSLDFLRSMPNLREVSLTGVIVEDFSPLLSCRNLRVLKLKQARVSEEQLESVFVSNPCIEVLHIPHVDTPQLRFGYLARNLKELNIQGRPRYPFVPLYTCTSLHTLEVSKSSICPKYIRNVKSLQILIVHCSNGVLLKNEIKDLRRVVDPNLEIRVVRDE
jgi:hypothetical protein